MKLSQAFSRFADRVAKLTGKPLTFISCVLLIVVWAASGPVFHFSDTWQLVINTGTTIVTFLMVFLIQNSQNRDAAAIQAKLDELIRVSAAQNKFIGIEQLTDEQLTALRETDSPRAKKIAEALDAAEIAEDDAQAKAERAADQAA
jgi:low affinity Fe/Cu permease